jgi:hypothetical protein
MSRSGPFKGRSACAALAGWVDRRFQTPAESFSLPFCGKKEGVKGFALCER